MLAQLNKVPASFPFHFAGVSVTHTLTVDGDLVGFLLANGRQVPATDAMVAALAKICGVA